MPTLALPGTPEGDAVLVDDELDVGVNPNELVLDDPIIGQKPAEGKTKYLNAHVDPPPIRGLPTPKTMTHAQRLEHMVTHLPFDDGCELCVAGKRDNTPTAGCPVPAMFPTSAWTMGFSEIPRPTSASPSWERM